MVLAGLMDEAGMDGWWLRFVYWQPPAHPHPREEWRLAHQRALREAHGDDLDGNESAPYGLSVPANPRTLQMRGRGKGTEGRGRGQCGAGAGKHRPGAVEGSGGAGLRGHGPPGLVRLFLWLGTRL